MHRFPLAVWSLFVAISTISQVARASATTSASAQVFSPCIAFDSHVGTTVASATAACNFVFPQFTASYTASATAGVTGSAPFSTLSVAASVTQTAINFNNLEAHASAGTAQSVAISGGSGAGTVVYLFQITGIVSGDDSASILGSFGVTSGGSSQSFPACSVTTPVLFFNCGATLQTVPLTFTFNSPFTLQETLSSSVSTIGHNGDSSVTAVLTGITVHDATGAIVNNAQLAAVPEAASLRLLLLGCLGILFINRRAARKSPPGPDGRLESVEQAEG